MTDVVSAAVNDWGFLPAMARRAAFGKGLLAVVTCYLISVALPGKAQVDPDNWPLVLEQAHGQELYFNTWGGESRINGYLAWVAAQVRERFAISLQHVRLADTALAVSRVLAEKQAGNTDGGTIDLLWVNGENFAALKNNNLLFGPWSEQLPNFALVDADNFPEMRADFTVPVDGLEAPWLRAQLIFYFDSAVIADPPQSIPALLTWAKNNPGEFTYPKPPAFLGSTFLKQALLELARDSDALFAPVEQSDFEQITAVLWQYLDQLHPYLLRKGRYFPSNGAQLRRLMADGDTALAFSFSPNEVITGIRNRELPETARSYVLKGGTIANVSFLAIPFNASNKAAAMVVANYLLSAEAQAQASLPEQMGSTTVLSMAQLNAQQQALFDAIDLGPGAPSQQDLARTRQEPHPSWMPALEAAWLARYNRRQ